VAAPAPMSEPKKEPWHIFVQSVSISASSSKFFINTEIAEVVSDSTHAV
jgi:hypothetical protein